jgi:hypothetical protein
VQRDQPTTMEMVDVQSAPGAQVVFTVFYPNAKPWTYRTRLPWTGQKNLRWRIPPQTKGNRILVMARAKLGGLTGHTSMWFRGGNAPSSRQSRSSPGH